MLTRTHPHAYLAAFSNARAAGVTRLIITSNWRPMLGSIVHRAGLGLDVSYIGAAGERVQLNREVLRKTGQSSGLNVGQEEKARYDAYQDKSIAAQAAQTELQRLQRMLDSAESIAQKTALNAQISEQKERLRQTKADQSTATDAWMESVARNEPTLIKNYRAVVKEHRFVSQILDPWYMDLNTRDNVTAAANRQVDANEKIHADHLHITIHEAKLL